jgi:hypothetical protein
MCAGAYQVFRPYLVEIDVLQHYGDAAAVHLEDQQGAVGLLEVQLDAVASLGLQQDAVVWLGVQQDAVALVEVQHATKLTKLH